LGGRRCGTRGAHMHAQHELYGLRMSQGLLTLAREAIGVACTAQASAAAQGKRPMGFVGAIEGDA
jgi:hypothetical protein